MGGNMQKMMKQIQKMQSEIERIQEELADDRIEGTAGGGVVRAVVNGHQEFVEIHIDASAVDPEDVEMLEDLVLAACSEAVRLSKQTAETKMSKVTGKMSIPGLRL